MNNEEKSATAATEEKVLEFWRSKKIFEKTLEKAAPLGEFIFYEGPPTANGIPGIHHLEARAFKDIIPRYKTMRGFHVARKAGWDTHGLPVELQVEKELGLKSKKEIEEYGIEAFNKKCKESVWKYVDIWDAFTDRIGYWLDRENPYVTYEKTYMESVWNILKTVSEKRSGGKSLLYKDYKVVPWCPRCGTALSSHELAQGYEDVKDLSVTVKLKVVGEPNTFLLAWTTTPWTLPGNVALAVGEKIDYSKIEVSTPTEKINYIMATDLVNKIFDSELVKDNLVVGHQITGSPVPGSIQTEYKLVSRYAGKDLIGLEYEPLYPFLSEKFADKSPEAFAKAFKVYSADFVTTEDGTGIVHTAVMYGQEDFELGTKIGLPKHHLVLPDGHFSEDMGFLSGRFVREEETAVEIIKDLAHRGLLFRKEKYAHTYPHCWRCKTPLIYYARDSWYIRMSDLRDELVKENNSINWEPSHIKEGRFGEWLREVKDWAISRERYWGTPLPIWENKAGEIVVIGSVAELKEKIPKRNNYFLMRHGEALSNISDTGDKISSNINDSNPLTDAGRQQIKKVSRELEKIDVIFTSPFGRSKESAEIIKSETGFQGEIIEDPRLGEVQAGLWDGKPWEEYQAQFKSVKERFQKHVEGAPENWEDTRVRVAAFMYEIDAKYEGKNILIVGHGGPLNLIALSSNGYSVLEIAAHYYDDTFKNAEIKKVDWRSLPHNEKFEIDLHRPFIDSVVLYDEKDLKKAEPLKRVKEVLDVWFDSGAMPFAQDHYPFEGRSGDAGGQGGFLSKIFDSVAGKSNHNFPYPSDYISEAIDQTRGWFYTLHAIGILMGKGKAYKNVVCLGHILDSDGKKMSKSLGNIIDPWLMMNKYGADALRLWMYTVNQPGDSKNFDERSVDEIVKKVFNLAGNIATFYELYSVDKNSAEAQEAEAVLRVAKNSPHILDRWIISRLNLFIKEGTDSLDQFKVFEAARSIRDFVGDFSTWYIRRSRDRFKSDDAEDRKNALATTRFVLLELSKYIAPFTPFFAEQLYAKVKFGDNPESVHLENWPSGGKTDKKILLDMEEVRRIVSLALEARAKAGVKVRQPLAKLYIKTGTLQGKKELLDLVLDEVNIKEIVFDEKIESEVTLDTNITDALREEGNLRELVRFIQDLRKKAELEPSDKVALSISTDAAGEEFIKKFRVEILKSATLSDVRFDKNISGNEFEITGIKFNLNLSK